MALQAAASQPPSQAAIAATQAEIRGRANELIERARTTPAGPRQAIPAERTERFQQLVNRQHDRAMREGAVNTGAALVGAAVGGAVHHAAAHSAPVVAQQLSSVMAGVGTQVTGTAIGLVRGHHLDHASAHGAVDGLAETLLGPLGAGVVLLGQTVANIDADANERVAFQQRATAQDAARAEAIQRSTSARNFGELDGQIAAAGRTEINWEIYRTNGDYAAGVNRGLRQAAQDPGSVAHHALGNAIPMRLDLSGR